MKRYFFFLICMVMIVTVHAAPPAFYAIPTDGYIISVPNFEAVKLNTPFDAHIHVINKSNGRVVNYTTCFVHTYNHEGDEVAEEQAAFVASSQEYVVTLNSANFSQKGVYEFRAFCSDSSGGGLTDGAFYVTTDGLTPAGDVLTVFIYILFIVVGFFVIINSILALARLVMTNETVITVIISWSTFFALVITNYLAKAYLLSYFMENVLDALIAGLGVLLVGVPVISLVITMIMKGVAKKKPLSPGELTGNVRWFNYG